MLDIPLTDSTADLLPAYLRDVYTRAYLTPSTAKFFDRQVVVQAILWGNAKRLIGDVLDALQPGDRVFQPAAVYGDFSRLVARRVGPQGRLDVRDIAPFQVRLTRRKLADLPQANVGCADAADPEDGEYDAVACFFLLHEVPDYVKVQVIRAMLGLVGPTGKAVFVDYHRPRPWHPLRPLMKRIFERLEPFAASLWSHEIQELAGKEADGFQWRKSTRFGGMYQIVTADRVHSRVSLAPTDRHGRDQLG